MKYFIDLDPLFDNYTLSDKEKRDIEEGLYHLVQDHMGEEYSDRQGGE